MSAGVSDLISAIDQKVHRQEPLAEIVASLDAARVPLCGYFNRHLGSPIAAQALTLKVLNVLLAKQHLLRRSTAVLSRPYGLLVDPSNGCNLACPGCVHSSSVKALKIFDWNKGLLSESRFRGFLEYYGSYALQIMFCNYGEPITNPNTPKLIAMAKSYFVQTALSTNLAIRRFDAEAYVRSGLDFLFLSIDGATQSVYEKYRKNGDIEVVYRNIQNMVKAKRTLHRRTPVIRWQFLAFEHNAHEIPLALAQAKALGVDQFAVETPFDVSWDDPAVGPAAVPPMNVELDTGTEEKLSKNWDVQLDEVAAQNIEREFEASWGAKLAGQRRVQADQPQVRSNHTCHWLYKNMVMDANGRIIPCCAAPRPDANLVFFNFAGERPEDCFNSELYQTARLYFADKGAYYAEREPGSPAPFCVDCDWEQLATDIGPAQIAQCLRTFGKGSINARTIELLSAW